MGKARSVMKYASAGVVTALFTASTIRKLQGVVPPPVPPVRFAVVSGVLIALTWVAALA